MHSAGSFVHLESEVTFAGGKSCEVYVRGDAVNIYAKGGPGEEDTLH